MKEVGKKHSLGMLALRRAGMLLCVSCRNFLPLAREWKHLTHSLTHSLPEEKNKTKHNSSIMGLFKPADPGTPSSCPPLVAYPSSVTSICH